MKFKRPVQKELEINLTPMIDCLLFLLVFLLVSTSFTKHSRIQINLPHAQHTNTETKKDNIKISIDSAGHYFVNGQALSDNSEQQLTTSIQQAIQQQHHAPSDLTIQIAADAKAIHQDVVRVMEVSKNLGITDMNIDTQNPTTTQP